MNSRWIVGLGSAAVLGLAAWAATPQETQAIKSLADAAAAIEALNARIAALEAQLEAMESGPADRSDTAAPMAAAPAGQPVMRLEAVETIKPDETVQARVRQLTLEADGLEQQAAALDNSARSIVVDTREGADDLSAQQARKQMASIRQQAGEARRQARAKRNEIKDLSTPKQIIRGWSGKREVEAYTERDLSAALTKIPVGSYITGKYTLVDIDDHKAVVRVSDIKQVNKPADFVERPAGSGH